MTDTASERIRIDAPADRCFDVAVDYESYPEWLRDVKEAKILESDSEGRGLRVEYRAAALGKSIRYVLAYDYTGAPGKFSWQFVEGDMLRRLDPDAFVRGLGHRRAPFTTAGAGRAG